MKKRNPYKIVSFGSGLYGVEHANYPHVGIPESWGSKQHALRYMAALLWLTYDEYKGAQI